jgi:hypothetical protein
VNISDEAVEQAQEQLDAMGVSVSKKYMRAALEAAAPHLMAQAWDEGQSAGYDEGSNLDADDTLTAEPARNPYCSAGIGE